MTILEQLYAELADLRRWLDLVEASDPSVRPPQVVINSAKARLGVITHTIDSTEYADLGGWEDH